VELLHKLHDELKYDSLEALTRASPRTATTRAPGSLREFEGAAGGPTR
jgi:hypothetical protein